MNETAKVINQDEKIIWQGQPQFWPYLMGSFGTIIFGFFWCAFLSPFIYYFFMGKAPFLAWVIFSPFILIGIYCVLFSPLYSFLVYKFIWYVITDKRIILQSGLVGRDFDYLDFDKVENATVDVGVVDKVFGRNSGNVLINRTLVAESSRAGGGTSTEALFIFIHITDPYAVFELLKKSSFDVKADINYPNALRPKENKGYNTEYNSADKIS